MSKKVTVMGKTEYHHMPDFAETVDCDGMSVRKAIATLRDLDWGDMGGTHVMYLSDSSTMGVELTPSSEGGLLASSQRICREWMEDGRLMRRYYKI